MRVKISLAVLAAAVAAAAPAFAQTAAPAAPASPSAPAVTIINKAPESPASLGASEEPDAPAAPAEAAAPETPESPAAPADVSPAAAPDQAAAPASPSAAPEAAAAAPDSSQAPAPDGMTEPAAAPEPPPPPPEPTLAINIDLTAQRMTVSEDGVTKYTWPVSSARYGYRTPTGTFKPVWMSKMWYSRQYDYAPMPNAIFFHKGVAIHGSYATGALGRPASHGCVRLAPKNAAALFRLVNQHGKAKTTIVVHGTPDHTSQRIASEERRAVRRTYTYGYPPPGYAYGRRYAYDDYYYAPPRLRRYYAQPRRYYAPRGLYSYGF